MFPVAPEHIAISAPAFETGIGFTVTVMASVPEQVLFDTVTVYVVVTVGDATGLDIVELLNPVDGDHE